MMNCTETKAQATSPVTFPPSITDEIIQSHKTVEPCTERTGPVNTNPAIRTDTPATGVLITSPEPPVTAPFAGDRDLATPSAPEPAVFTPGTGVKPEQAAPGMSASGLHNTGVIAAGLPVRIVTGTAGTKKSDRCVARETLTGIPEGTSCEQGRPSPPPDERRYLRGNGIVFEAMDILAGWHYMPARFSNTAIPVDVIAFKKESALIAQVIHSRTPVPDAKTLSREYAAPIQNLRMMGTTTQFRKIVMVYSSRCGWKYYDVLPGGLIPAWNLAEDERKNSGTNGVKTQIRHENAPGTGNRA